MTARNLTSARALEGFDPCRTICGVRPGFASASTWSNTWRRERTLLLVVLLSIACRAPGTDEIDVQRRKWDAHRPANYTYTYAEGGFGSDRQVRVVVRSGRVESFDVVREQIPGVRPPICRLDGNDLTMEGVFDQLLCVLRKAQDVKVLHYDPVRGFPTEIAVDPSSAALDDQFGITVKDFNAES
jgi:hypothetical protein